MYLRPDRAHRNRGHRTSKHFYTEAVWDIVDETYNIGDADEDSHILLTTDHPQSMKTIAWTRTFGKARVFCYRGGASSV